MKTLLATALLLTAVSAFAQADAGTGTEAAEPTLDVSRLPFTPDSIRQVMNFHQPKIQACYEDLLAGRTRVVEGRIMTSFTITPEGLVKHPRVLKKGTTLRERKLHDCVVAVLAGMEFPKPKDGREHPIEYPFNLKAIK